MTDPDKDLEGHLPPADRSPDIDTTLPILFSKTVNSDEEIHTKIPSIYFDGEEKCVAEVPLSPVIIMVQSPVPLLGSPQVKRSHSRLSSLGPVCRICHEDDGSEPLIAPCECIGTLELIHASCLEKWLSASNSSHCEICKFHFTTRRHPRPLVEWFHSSAARHGPQGVYGDMLCLLVLTPLCLVSVYLCGIGAAVYMRHGVWEGTGLAMLCCFLLATYVLWCVVTIRFHLRVLRRWQSSNQVVHLAPTEQRRVPTAEEVNNNAHQEEVELHEFT